MNRFFLDRSLGRKIVPQHLFEAGWDVLTMHDHYGKSRAQIVDDVSWIRDMTRAGYALLTADSRMVSNVLERAAILDEKAVVFIIPAGDLTGQDMAVRFTRHSSAITEAAHAGGPAAFAVYENRISRVLP